MRSIVAVFVICMILLFATFALVMNGYPFYVWVPVFAPVPFGQYWLMTRPVKLPPV